MKGLWLRGGRLAAVAALLASGALAGGGHHYTRARTEFCQSCHEKVYVSGALPQGTHISTLCQACHKQPTVVTVRLFWEVVLGRRKDGLPRHGSVNSESCLECHGKADYLWLRASASRQHKLHGEKGVDCLECHAVGIHERQLPDASCQQCHADAEHTVTKPGKSHCTNCHDFKRETIAETMDHPDCITCHQQAGVVLASYPAQGPMKWPCYSCHKGHEPEVQACPRCHGEGGRQIPTSAGMQCVDCHKPHSWNVSGKDTCLGRGCHDSGAPRNVYAHGIPNHDNCLACHVPHQWRLKGQEVCKECHEREKAMPHRAGWLKVHSAEALKSILRCTGCHDGRRFCDSCHRLPMPHGRGWEKKTAHGAAAERQAGTCYRCHRGGKKCLECHKDKNKPPSHGHDWREVHFESALREKQLCLLCHGEKGCDRCHLLPMPHPGEWVVEGHKKVATFLEDAACFRCHQRRWCGICHVSQ